MKKEIYMMDIGVVGAFLTLPILFYGWSILSNTWIVGDSTLFITSFMTIIVFLVVAKIGYNLSKKETKKYDWSGRKAE